jgi:RNA-directed DNA polymerase
VKELKEELRQRWHESVAELGRWLRSVVQGYFNYHAVPGISPARDAFGWK